MPTLLVIASVIDEREILQCIVYYSGWFLLPVLHNR